MSRIALRFDNNAQSRWRQFWGRPGFRRLIISMELPGSRGWISFKPDAKVGMDIERTDRRPPLNPGDFEISHKLTAKHDVALARFLLGRKWWQGPWTISGLRKLLARQTMAVSAKVAGAAATPAPPFRPIEPAAEPVPFPVKTGSTGDA